MRVIRRRATCHLLSGLAAVEAERRRREIPRDRLAAAAGLNPANYRRALRSGVARASTVRKLKTALRQIGAADSADRDLLRAVYRLHVAQLAPRFGVTVAAVLAADPRAGLTADREWTACRHVAQTAIYLINTSLGIRHREIARLLGLTPAAVCLALKSVEDRRDDPAFEQIVTEVEHLLEAA